MLTAVCRVGTTLVELLAVLVLLAMVGGAIMRLAVGQRRFLDAVGQIIETERVAREGADIPRQELRGVAPTSGGIYEMAADHVDFRSLTGGSVICTIDSSRTALTIPDRRAASALTSWITAPREGDSVLIFGIDADSASARWHAHTLVTAPVPGGLCPVSTGLASTSAEEGDALSLQIAPPLGPAIGSGAVLRFFRRARYESYRAGDGRWYLGFFDCAPARSVPCSTVQPVSGPFATGGIRLEFRDSSGVGTLDPSRVARIDVLSASVSTVPLRAMGFALGFRFDTVRASIALRNR
jgi:hypothetical protein